MIHIRVRQNPNDRKRTKIIYGTDTDTYLSKSLPPPQNLKGFQDSISFILFILKLLFDIL